ncbi:MAG: replication protein C, IncQ-type, partial [Desulfurivibrionaceae bacterium]
PNTCGPSGTRDRKARIRKALQEIETVGWTINEYAAGKYEITRPRTNTDTSPD